MKQYLENLDYIMTTGENRIDRTGVGTRSIFGLQTRYNLRDSFPALTTKRLAWKAVVSELIWFLEGSGYERRLCRILHGTTNPNKKTIWTANANTPDWQGECAGDLGRIYGKQWRSWRSPVINGQLVQGSTVTDQIANVIKSIKTDPHSRRHIVTAWNPGEMNQVALPPCHILFQFYVNNNNELSCQLYQRSADFFLGVPFNIASYALLTHMIAQVCGLKVGEFIHTIGDAHIYSNHISQVKLQLSREPSACPRLNIDKSIDCIDNFTMDSFELFDYKPQDAINAPMAI
ncbi:MAG: thymidylate synthase [Deltaproteobacteria bacterium]|nr:MAG: thymidylate synthase [Deltaproteobacteria bacterium]